jgi:15-cis-phytoene desaturase
MSRVEVVVVGAGLAGLSCAHELAVRGHDVLVLEAREVVGGRCSSWSMDGMPVESGYHRMLGSYSALPDLLARAGVAVDDIVCGEDEVEIRSSDGTSAILGASPVHKPVRTALGPVAGAAPLSAPDWVSGTGHALLDASPLRGLTAPLRAALLPIDVIADSADDFVRSWPTPLRQMVLPLVERGLMSQADLVSLGPFFAAGMAAFEADPDRLDRWSVERMADRFGVSDRALDNFLGAATAGLFFVPPHRFSAVNLFGLAHAASPRLHEQRLGAFLGGMTEVMCQPIADAASAHGASIRTGVTVTELTGSQGRVQGVRTAEGEDVTARHVVLATALGPAQRLIGARFGDHRWFRPMLGATITPSVNIQFELRRPSAEVDRTTFGPGTCVGNYAEQSRTTFRHVPGRCQVTLTPPERFLGRPDRWVAERAIAGLHEIGIDISGSVNRYRVLSQPDDFLGLEPGNWVRRPGNRTPVPGLVLAGDYTDQKWLSLMEGAVRSGSSAARVVVADEPVVDPPASEPSATSSRRSPSRQSGRGPNGRAQELAELRIQVQELSDRLDDVSL